MAVHRNERPIARINPGGDKVWVARWTDATGRRRIGWPREIKGTYKLKREAQEAINACYEREAREGIPVTGETVGGYSKTWLDRHPRTLRTEESYAQRVRYVLDVELDKRALREWPINDLGRKQANDLVDHMLRVQGRAADGARGVLRVLSAMWQDAIDDELVVRGNPFMGLRIRANDPRVSKPPRRKSVWTWEQMHSFAAAAGAADRRWGTAKQWQAVYAEPMLRTLADVGGLRIGELLPLERDDLKLKGCREQGCTFAGPHMHIRRTAYKGTVSAGTKTDHGEVDAGRVAPVPASVAVMLAGLPARIDTRLLFPNPRGGLFGRDFYRDVWEPAREATGMQATPHEFRHSYVSLMRAAGVDPADLAAWTGHTVLTATTRYTHSTGASAELARAVIG